MRFFGYTLDPKRLPRHVAFIMDGNGRWAQRRLLPRNEGHKQGYLTLKRIIEFNEQLKIPYISAYAFSTENWNRPPQEVNFLLSMTSQVIDEYLPSLKDKNIRFCYTGSFERLPQDLCEKLQRAMKETENGQYVFNIVFNYSGQQEIVDATQKIISTIQEGNFTEKNISKELFERFLYNPDIPPVDLLIRTSGELRISNFLLWQIAYAELYFTTRLWPDFCPKDFCMALADYQKRERRFGKIYTEGASHA